MNILPKKSWHVRSRENVARVRRDEAAAEEEQRQRDKRARRAEQEARTNLLRKKARLRGGTGGDPREGRSSPPRPLLLPPPLETGNREHEEEKRLEQERRERALGILTYLGQSSAEAQTAPPWYQRPPPRRGKGGQEEDGRGEVEGGCKAALDPLLAMKRRVGKGRSPPLDKDNTAHLRQPRKAPSGCGTSLEELRQQRLQREAEEGLRARALLQGLPGGPSPSDFLSDERSRPYNSQFNPHLARGGRPLPSR